MVFVGFEDGSKAIRYWDKAMRKIKVLRNIVFNENEEPTGLEEAGEVPGVPAEGEIEKDPASQDTTKSELQEVPQVHDETTKPETRNLQLKPRIDYKQLNNPSTRKPPVQKKSSFTIQIPTTPPDVTRPTEASKAKAIEKDKANLTIDTPWKNIPEEYTFRANKEDLPKKYEDAIRGDEGEKWKAAMDEEIEMLRKMGTWKLEDLPEDRKPIGCRWVYNRKRNEHGEVVKYKARLVAQGFSQKPGTNYNNDGTFAPVMQFETLRTLLAFSAVHNLKLRQFDVKSTYLHGRLNEIIYMAQPPGDVQHTRLTSESSYFTSLEHIIYHASTSRSLVVHNLDLRTTRDLPHLLQRVIAQFKNIAALFTAPGQVYTSYRAVPTSQITQNIENIDRKNVAQVYQRYSVTKGSLHSISAPACRKPVKLSPHRCSTRRSLN
jgi:hypothetical protein